MSQENVEIVRTCLRAFDRGEYAAAMEALHPDISYELTHFPDGQVYRGHDGVREAFRIWIGTWDDYRQERDEIIDAGDEVVVATREYGRGKGSGLQLDRLTYGIWTLRDAQVVRVRFCSTNTDALEAAGLSA